VAATLSISIITDARRARQDLDATGADIERLSDRADKSSSRLGSSMAGIGKAVAAVGAAGIAGFALLAKSSWEAAEESAKIGRETERVIKTTGATAWTSAGQIDAMADSFSNVQGVDDEVVQGVANLLLTFTNVKDVVGAGNDVFTQATGLASDMAQVLGTDASGAAIQLGKALNDPMRGITALSKAGVSFTEDQKKQIKTLQESGDVLGAQKIILAELSKEFGGAAAAAATPFDRLKIVVGNAQESLGEGLIPVAERAATWLADRIPGAIDILLPKFTGLASWIVDSGVPAIEKMVTWVGTHLSGAFEFLSTVIGKSPLGTVLQIVVDFFKAEPGEEGLLGWLKGKLMPVFETVKTFVEKSVMPVLDTFKTWVGAEITPKALELLSSGLTTIKDVVVDTILPKLKEVADWFTTTDFKGGMADAGTEGESLGTKLGAFYNDHLKPLGDYLGGLFMEHIKGVSGFFTAWATVIATILTPVLTWLFENVFTPLVNYIRENGEVFEALGRILRVIGTVVAVVLLIPIFALVVAFIAVVAAIGLVIAVLGAIMVTSWKVIQVFWDFAQNIKDAIATAFFWVWEKVNEMIGFLGGIGGRIAEFAVNMFNSITDAITGAKDWVVGKFDEIVEFVKGLPGKISEVATGIWDGIGNGLKAMLRWVADLWNSSIGALSITIPWWVPVIGDKRFDFPKMPVPEGLLEMASGGIITGPTLALLGEAGPEAVIPLGRLGGNTYIVNVTTTGLGADSPQISRDVVAAIRAYERRNGPLASVATASGGG